MKQAEIGFKRSFATLGIVLLSLFALICIWGLFLDLSSLWRTGVPHINQNPSGKSAWLSELDNLSGGWLSMPVFGTIFSYIVYSIRNWVEVYIEPNEVVYLTTDVIHFKKIFFADSSVDLRNVTSVELSFDPKDENSRSNHWFWGEWNERLTIRYRRLNGKTRRVVIHPGRVAGECDALAYFTLELKAAIQKKH